MFKHKQHTMRTDEVAHEILSAVEDDQFGPHSHGLARAWRMVTESHPMLHGSPTPALVNAAARHRTRYGIKD